MSNFEISGRAIASLLAGAWRRIPPLLTRSALELNQLVCLPPSSGVRPLAYWRLLHSGLEAGPFRDDYLRCALRSITHEQELVTAFSQLRAVGIEPILIKGWAISRLYPETGLRPAGDIDLCIMPEQQARAAELLAGQSLPSLPIDLKHDEIGILDQRGFAELWERSL